MRCASITSGMSATATANRSSQAGEWSPRLDGDEHGEAQPHQLRIDDRDRRSITPSASSRWMRFQHGVGRQTDLLGKLGDREGGILLQQGEKLAVGGVQGRRVLMRGGYLH